MHYTQIQCGRDWGCLGGGQKPQFNQKANVKRRKTTPPIIKGNCERITFVMNHHRVSSEQHRERKHPLYIFFKENTLKCDEGVRSKTGLTNMKRCSTE